MTALRDDVVRAVRRWARSPHVALAAIAIVAAAVALNASVFSLTNAVLLRPLAFPQPERLVSIAGLDRQGRPMRTVSYPMARDWERQADVFESVAAFGWVFADVRLEPHSQRVRTLAVSDRFFPTLGVAPLAGRLLGPDDFLAGRPPALVLTEGAWRRWFGADPAAVGRRIELSNTPEGAGLYEVVGVAPAGVRLHQFPAYEFYVPASARSLELVVVPMFNVIGRLRPGVTAPHAQAALQAMAGSAAGAGAGETAGGIEMREGTAVVRGRPAGMAGVRVESLHEVEVGRVRRPLLFLHATTLLVLLAACANVAGLLLAAGVARVQELAVRMAIGASRWRIVRMLLVEHGVIAVGACLGALAATPGVIRLLVGVAPAELPRLDAVQMDWAALPFSLAAAAVAGVAFGVLPAVLIARFSPAQLLHAAAVSGSRSVWRHRLLAAQVVLVAALAVPAALLGRSLWGLLHVPLGFDPRHVVAAHVVLGGRYADPASHTTFLRNLVGRTTRTFRTDAVTLSDAPPATPEGLSSLRLPEGSSSTSLAPVMRRVSAGYFRVLDIPIVEGRALEDADGETANVVVNAALARYLPGGRAVGERLGFNPQVTFTVVGVAADVREWRVTDEPLPTIYCHIGGPGCRTGSVWMMARASVPPRDVPAMFRRMVHDLDPTLPVVTATTLSARIDEAMADVRFMATTLNGLAWSGIVLVAFGILAGVQYQVARSRREIAIRLALGGSPAAVGREFAGRVIVVTAIATGAGLAGGVLGSRFLQAYLYGLTPADPLAIGAAAGVVMAAAATAAYLPARRAARLDPAATLRES